VKLAGNQIPADLEQDRLRGAARQLETLVLKQLVSATKAFSGGDGAGSAIRADLFADALADAMVKGGGIGLARQIEDSLTRRGSASAVRDPGVLDPAAPVGIEQAPFHRVAGGFGKITSSFGLRHDPFDGHLTRHEGVDLAGPEGAQIRAVAGGVVRRAGDRGGYGSTVEIDHGHGLTTLYAHASELLVHDGDPVAPGQPIARVGQTGRATGSHLHFEVRVAGKPVDPARALKIYELRADDVIESGS
jgi:murein DD-endopeptidase MepM/ murein hydrolase activator NlpD